MGGNASITKDRLLLSIVLLARLCIYDPRTGDHVHEYIIIIIIIINLLKYRIPLGPAACVLTRRVILVFVTTHYNIVVYRYKFISRLFVSGNNDGDDDAPLSCLYITLRVYPIPTYVCYDWDINVYIKYNKISKRFCCDNHDYTPRYHPRHFSDTLCFTARLFVIILI